MAFQARGGVEQRIHYSRLPKISACSLSAAAVVVEVCPQYNQSAERPLLTFSMIKVERLCLIQVC